jgi:uncharacterized membrane protein
MPTGLLVLIMAVAGFVGGHFLLSHALRAPAVAVFGRAGFQVVYSVVAIAMLIVIMEAYRRAPPWPMLWSPDTMALQIVFDVAGYFAVALFVASLIGNPGMVGANLNGLSTRVPHGVYLITRHPMMFAIAIWCAVEILIGPSLRNLISCGGLIVLALLGAHLQDRKKTAQTGREWGQWVSRTPFWPDLRRIGGLGVIWGLAAIPWLLATWLQVRVTLVSVGVWYFFPQLPY